MEMTMPLFSTVALTAVSPQLNGLLNYLRLLFQDPGSGLRLLISYEAVLAAAFLLAALSSFALRKISKRAKLVLGSVLLACSALLCIETIVKKPVVSLSANVITSISIYEFFLLFLCITGVSLLIRMIESSALRSRLNNAGVIAVTIIFGIQFLSLLFAAMNFQSSPAGNIIITHLSDYVRIKERVNALHVSVIILLSIFNFFVYWLAKKAYKGIKKASR